MTALPADLALDNRAGWPADLRLLIDRYPREVWTGHANLGETARFWLSRHGMFREIAESLKQASTAFREGTARLGRHLRDEEDLIVPLVLDRGEADLGFG